MTWYWLALEGVLVVVVAAAIRRDLNIRAHDAERHLRRTPKVLAFRAEMDELGSYDDWYKETIAGPDDPVEAPANDRQAASESCWL